MSRFVLPALLLMSVARIAGAELIDDFSASQGPYTVGPGEEISEEQGILETETVLGGFRVFVPGLDAEAPAGSSITGGVAGGEMICDVNMASSGSDSGGGCGSGYDRGDSELFDLTGSSAFELDVELVQGSIALQVSVFGPDDNGAMAADLSPSAGSLSIPFSEFTQLTGTPVEWDRIDTILVTVAVLDGESGELRLDRFGTDGPIANGEAVPGEEDQDPPPDGRLQDQIYGNFYNPQRDGEGIQLTLENDGSTFILTYYTYLDGEQVWLIGTGELLDGRIVFDNMHITGGADYGSAFDSEDAEYTFWGEIDMRFVGCNEAVLYVAPELEEFEPYVVEMQRIVPTVCDFEGPPNEASVVMGNWYDPERDGEGFQLAYEEGDYILTFYTYVDGKQLWMIGLGERNGDVLTFPEVYITRGGDFGGRFRSEDVENVLFGDIEMVLDDCNIGTVTVNASLEGFEDQVIDVEKIVTGECNP